MCSSTESTNKSRFHIELLADKSLVLVNARGYESEIFLPELQKGRVCLRNVIFSRQPRSSPDEINSRSSSSNHQCKRMGSVKLTTATAGLAPNPGRIDNIGELRFELKLISNGNVVLVECKGYESEIFLPHILSHCVAMKRISAYELAQCSSLKSSTTKPSNDSPASIAASLGTQTVGLPNCLITPIKASNIVNKEKRGQRLHKSQQVTKTKKKPQKDKSSPRQKKKRCKQYVKETRDVSN